MYFRGIQENPRMDCDFEHLTLPQPRISQNNVTENDHLMLPQEQVLKHITPMRRNRCNFNHCNRKISIQSNGKCDCKMVFCKIHRACENHDCQY